MTEPYIVVSSGESDDVVIISSDECEPRPPPKRKKPGPKREDPKSNKKMHVDVELDVAPVKIEKLKVKNEGSCSSKTSSSNPKPGGCGYTSEELLEKETELAIRLSLLVSSVGVAEIFLSLLGKSQSLSPAVHLVTAGWT